MDLNRKRREILKWANLKKSSLREWVRARYCLRNILPHITQAQNHSRHRLQESSALGTGSALPTLMNLHLSPHTFPQWVGSASILHGETSNLRVLKYKAQSSAPRRRNLLLSSHLGPLSTPARHSPLSHLLQSMSGSDSSARDSLKASKNKNIKRLPTEATPSKEKKTSLVFCYIAQNVFN